MLTIYFSATGNTEFIARVFSRQMGAVCMSIEDDANFAQTIKAHDTIAFCYPIFGSRVPRNMREFVARYISEIIGKKIIIFVTQAGFSGDGARVFTDMFKPGAVDVIYAEHFKMPSNVGNIPFLCKASAESILRQTKNAEAKMIRVCEDIKNGKIKKRGFSRFSKVLGNIQGFAWQGNSKKIGYRSLSAESKARNGIKIHSSCTVCNHCVGICPVGNFANEHGKIVPKGNCIVCYRCVNRCPQKAIKAMMVPFRARWQYVHPSAEE